MNNSKSQKFIVFISLLLALCFLFIFAFSFIYMEQIKQLKINNFNNQIYNINHKNNIYNSLVNQSNVQTDTPIFSSSKEAIITATENLKTRENFYVYSPGTVTTTAGLQVVVSSQSQIWKFSGGEMFEELIAYQTKGIDMGQTGASQTYTKGGETFRRTSESAKNTQNGLTCTFGSSAYNKISLQSTNILHYTFNKNTILNESDLIIYKNSSGKITHYAVDFNLSTIIGLETYAKVIKDNSNGAAKSLPHFKTINMHMEIDALGNILNLYVYEVCTMNVGITATLTNEFNYIFKNLESAPPLTKPIIN